MGAQVGQGGGPAAEVLRDGAGFQGAQPHPALRRGGAHRLHKVDQALPIFEIVSPGGDFDAGEHQLPVAHPGKALCLTGGLLQGKGADRPPGVGNDTVGAEVDAAILHLEHGPGAPFQAAGGQMLILAAAQGVVHPYHRVSAVGAEGLQRVQKAHAVGRAHDQIHPQGLHRLRIGLGVAAAHRHHRVGGALAGLPDHLAGFLVAHRRDGAGVDHIGVRRPVKGHQGVAPAGELRLHRLRLVLVDLAAQGVDSNSHVFSSHMTAALCEKNRISGLPRLSH